MAKTRIQMRSADIEEAIEEHKRIPRPLEYHHAKMRHAGPLDILGRALRDEGIAGLYQVSSFHMTDLQFLTEFG